MEEKRKCKRIEKPYIARLHIKPDKVWYVVAVNDLGAGGIFFHDRRNMEIGTTMDLKIGFSMSIPPIECRGVVTRVRKHPKHSVFGIVTEFKEIDEHIKKMINETALSVNPDNQFLFNKV